MSRHFPHFLGLKNIINLIIKLVNFLAVMIFNTRTTKCNDSKSFVYIIIKYINIDL